MENRHTAVLPIGVGLYNKTPAARPQSRLHLWK